MSQVHELQEQIEAQARQIAELKEQVASLTRKSAPKTVPSDEGAKIFHPTARLNDLPDEDECRRLLRVVCDRYPFLQQQPSPSSRWADTDQRVFFDGFCGALAWCDVAATRTDKLDHKYDVRSWKDEASVWASAMGLQGPPTVGCFIAACVASDVKYGSLDNFPHNLLLGLGYYAHIVRGGWRRVLKDGPAEPVRGAAA